MKSNKLFIILVTFLFCFNIVVPVLGYNIDKESEPGQIEINIEGQVIETGSSEDGIKPAKKIKEVEIVVKQLNKKIRTNDEGYFKLDNIPAGTYDFIIKGNGYHDSSYKNYILEAGTYTFLFAVNPKDKYEKGYEKVYEKQETNYDPNPEASMQDENFSSLALPAYPSGTTVHYYDPAQGKYVDKLMGIETYLRYVLPQEMYTSWPMGALKAQAIAARTYTVYHTNKDDRHPSDPYNVCSSTHCQAFDISVTNSNTDSAISQTSRTVPTYNSNYCDGVFFSYCNGNTKSAQSVWGTSVPYLLSVSCPYDTHTNYFGHGVGLCQYGAKGYAEHNVSSYDIIKHYYTNVSIVTVP